MVLLVLSWLSPLWPALLSLSSRPGTRNFVPLSGLVFHDSELMTSMARKLQELEQQLKVQNDELLSKVGHEGRDREGTAREDCFLRLN